MLSLWKNKKVIVHFTSFTKYGNCYTIIDQTIDIELITNLLLKNNGFKPQLSHNTKNTKFMDFVISK